MGVLILESAYVSWGLSLGVKTTLIRARFSLDLTSLILTKSLKNSPFLVVMLDNIPMKVASTEDEELLVTSAMMFSKIDLSAVKVVSLTPLMVRLVDITKTSGASKIYLYIHI